MTKDIIIASIKAKLEDLLQTEVVVSVSHDGLGLDIDLLHEFYFTSLKNNTIKQIGIVNGMPVQKRILRERTTHAVAEAVADMFRAVN